MSATKTGSPIDLSYARKLVDNYQKNKIGSVLPENETRAVWFSKEALLEALNVDPSTYTGGITGLRIYLGAYAEEQGYPANPFDYNKITLVLVQTNEEKIPIERGSEYEDAYLDIIKDPGAQPGYPGTNPSGDEKSTFNDGQGVPPPSGAIGLGLMDW